MPQRRAGNWVTRSAAIALLGVGLVACGDQIDTGTVVTPPPPATEEAGEAPLETHEATATIADGKLDPESFAGSIGTAFELAVTGDGTEHTLAIEELVDGETIAAEGETIVAFTIEGEPGSLEITLDGNMAGTFERQSASGIGD